jgi:hypothetical protein
MLDLESAFPGGSVVRRRGVRRVGDEVLLQDLPSPFVQLKDGIVKTTIAIKVFERENVVFFMREEADHTPPAKRNCSFAKRHRRAANLLVFILDKDILNGAYVHLRNRAAIPSKLQRVTLYF